MSEKKEIRVVYNSDHPLPQYKTEGSAGMDLYANLTVDHVSINPGERMLIPTGLFLELPKGYEAQIRPRSGLALRQVITVLNSPGTIDSDYRGEIGVILINHSNQTVLIHAGDRIAQMVITKYEQVTLNIVESLNNTKRGEGGFGHTGQ